MASKMTESNDNMMNAILVVTEDKHVIEANQQAANLLSAELSSLLNKPLNLDCRELLQGNGNNQQLTVKINNRSKRTLDASSLKLECAGKVYFVISFSDKTEQLKSTKLLEHQSCHDHLTGLPNRLLFETKMERAIQAAQELNQNFALLYLDMDNFKKVNDDMGHYVGDQLLVAVSSALQKVIRSTDTVARLGGDEFVIILSNLKKPSYAASVAQKVINKLNHSFSVEEHMIKTKISIGIAIYPDAGANIKTLMKSADSAMYNAKHNGKNHFRFFTDAFNTEIDMQLLDSGLDTAQ